jgi:hypothetical protein
MRVGEIQSEGDIIREFYALQIATPGQDMHAPATSRRPNDLDTYWRHPVPETFIAGCNPDQLPSRLGGSSRRQLRTHASCISVLDSSRLLAWSLFHQQSHCSRHCRTHRRFVLLPTRIERFSVKSL